MSNIYAFPIAAAAPSNILVGGNSALVLAQNTARQGLVMTNLSSSTMYLGLSGNAAVLNAGITLLANGGNWSMDEYSYSNEAINAIAHSSGNILAIQEFTR